MEFNMARTTRKTAAPVEALPVMEVEYVTPETYADNVERHAKRISAMSMTGPKLTTFTKPYTGREGTISAAVWVALCNADGLSKPECLNIALGAEQAAHRARGKAPKGTGLSAQGWLRTFGAVFE
jgi:hypothetical protein